MKTKKRNTAIVLGLFETGLAVGRSLGRKGIQVFGFEKKNDIGFYSRYINAKICPDPLNSENNFIRYLIEFGKNQASKPVIFITGDNFLLTVSKYRKELSRYFLLNLPKNSLIESISDKFSQYHLARNAGIDVPATYHFEDQIEIEKVREKLKFPMILKAREVNKWRNLFGGKKAIKVNTYEDLLNEFKILSEKKLAIICQEIIEGPDTNHFKYCACFFEGKEIAAFTLQKIRQFPIHYGIGSVVQSIENKELMEVGKKFFTKINYSGIGSAEFKMDQKDGKLKLIELNPRYWQQNGLSTACGINFPYIDYLLQTGNIILPIKSFKKGIKWVNIYSDFSSFIDYRKENNLTLLKWFESLKGKKVWSDFAWDDPLPGFYQIRFGLRIFKFPKYLKNKFKKSN